MDGAQKPRFRWIRLDLPTQPGYGEIDGAGRRPVHNSPDVAQQLVAMNDMVPALREISQNLELSMCQMNGRRAAPGGAGFEVHVDVSEPDSRHDKYCSPQ